MGSGNQSPYNSGEAMLQIENPVTLIQAGCLLTWSIVGRFVPKGNLHCKLHVAWLAKLRFRG